MTRNPFSTLIMAGAGSVLATPVETVLYSFTGLDGQYPFAGLIADNSGNLYGTVNGGLPYTGIECYAPGGCAGVNVSECGVVFKLAGTVFAVFAGTSGTPNCHGKSVSSLAKQDGSLEAAAESARLLQRSGIAERY